MSWEIKGGGNQCVFQRMFQRKNLCFEFLPENVVLVGEKFANMQDYFSDVSAKIKACLIQQTSSSFVSYEHLHSETTTDSNNVDLYCDSHDFISLTDSLTKFLTKAVTVNICELFNFFAYKSNPKSDMHAGIAQSPSE